MDDTEESWPVKIIRLSERHSFLAGRYFISHEWISQCWVSLAVIQTLDRIYVSWRYTRNRWTLGLDLYTSDVFDENDRIPWALRISLPDATACIRAPVHFTSYCFFHRVHKHFWIPEAPRRYRYSLSLSLSLSHSHCRRPRNPEPSSQPAISTHGPLLFTKRPINVCGRSFPVHSSPGPDSAPIFVLYFSRVSASLTAILSQSSISIVRKTVDQVRFFFLSRRNVDVVDCKIETEFLLLFLSSVYYDVYSWGLNLIRGISTWIRAIKSN